MTSLRAYILSYDIANAKRLRAMRKLAKAFGRPLQYSVFVCLLRREDRVRLAARVEGLLVGGLDPRRILVLTFSNRAAREMADPETRRRGPSRTRSKEDLYHRAFAVQSGRTLPCADEPRHRSRRRQTS